jgi:hypothetical protein
MDDIQRANLVEHGNQYRKLIEYCSKRLPEYSKRLRRYVLLESGTGMDDIQESFYWTDWGLTRAVSKRHKRNEWDKYYTYFWKRTPFRIHEKKEEPVPETYMGEEL